jgi:hypothetical protein
MVEPTSITSILTAIGSVVGVAITGVGLFAGFIITQPLLIIALMLSIAGFAFGVVRGYIRF